MYVHNLGRIYVKFEHAFCLPSAQLDEFQSLNAEFYSRLCTYIGAAHFCLYV